MAVITTKSTYARCGLSVKNTTGEPGWKGNLVIEMFNMSRSDLMIFADEGILQMILIAGEQPEQLYNGKYQGQSGLKFSEV